MDKLLKYENLILSVLERYATIEYANLQAVNEIIADQAHHRYQLVTIGWKGYKRIHACTLHIDIIDGKLWIQNDQTEHGIAGDFVELGVPKSDIVLAYYSENKRKMTEFAVN